MNSKQSQSNDYEIGNYIIKETLGQGTFGKVKLGINKITNKKVAIKILDKSKIIAKEDQERVSRELRIIRDFNHPNVIFVKELLATHHHYYIVMEYCEGGELFHYIVKKRHLSEDEASFFYFQIINGLEYIHSSHVVHRDLKPENLLITKEHGLKIIDFGLSNYFNKQLLITPCGSPCYASPEMVSGKKYNGYMIDIWSTGIILYAMICGYLPFEDKENKILFKKILECKLDFPHHVSSLVKDLLFKILVTDPNKRITLRDIKKHPFFLKGKRYFQLEFGDPHDIEEEYNEFNKKQKIEKAKSKVKVKENSNSMKEIEKPTPINPILYQANNTDGCYDPIELNLDKETKRRPELLSSEIANENKELYDNLMTIVTANNVTPSKQSKNKDNINMITLPNKIITTNLRYTHANTPSPSNDNEITKQVITSKSPEYSAKAYINSKNNPVKISAILGIQSMRYPLYSSLLKKRKAKELQSKPLHSQSLKTHNYTHNQQQQIQQSNTKPKEETKSIIPQKINSITIKAPSISINLFDTNTALRKSTKSASNQYQENSYSIENLSLNIFDQTKNQSIKNHEKKKQMIHSLLKNSRLKINDNSIQNSKGYTDSVQKTQDNLPMRTKLMSTLSHSNNHQMSLSNRKKLSNLIENYRPVFTVQQCNNNNNTHVKINSLKLSDFYSPTKIPQANRNERANTSYNNSLSHSKKGKDFNRTLNNLHNHFQNLYYKQFAFNHK